MRLRCLPFTCLSLLFVSMLLTSAALAGNITVSAAASLTNAFKEIGALYEKSHPQTKVLLNFAASGPLLKQIEEGAPADVFASADRETMDKAVSKKLMDTASRVNFASNSLVLIIPNGQKDVAGVADLAKAAVKRIAVGNPDSVPVGRYTKDALGSQWESLKPKFVLAESVRQALDYVTRGETEAGFVYSSDAAIVAEKVKVVATLPTKTPVSYPIALVADSKNKTEAAAFLAFVLSPEGTAIMQRYGFGKP